MNNVTVRVRQYDLMHEIVVTTYQSAQLQKSAEPKNLDLRLPDTLLAHEA